MFNAAYWTVLLAAVSAFAFLGPGLRDYTHGTPRYQPTEIEAAKESIALSLLGQLQLSVGDLMWLKSMEYLHVGVVQRMPTEAEEASGFRKQESQNVAAGMGHTEGVSMILDPRREWRGIVGDIERHVKPYQMEHTHDDPVELIPWYELAVKMNPNLERLYTLGSFYLSDFAHEPGEARMLLESGLKANPMSFEIHGALGRLYVDFAEKLQDLKIDAEEHPKSADRVDAEVMAMDTESAYQNAIELLERAIELATRHREELAIKREVFDDFQNQVFGESYLYLSKAYLAQGKFEKSASVAEEGYTAVSRYGQRNLLNVQKRIALRRAAGEAIDSQDEEQIRGAREAGKFENLAPVGGQGRGSQQEEASTEVPLLTQLQLSAPPDLPTVAPTAAERAVLQAVRENPYKEVDSIAVAAQLEAKVAQEALDLLLRRGFLEHSEAGYALLAPGLYVAMGVFDFDFWERVSQDVNPASGS